MDKIRRKGVVLIIVLVVVSSLSVLAFGMAFRTRVRMKTANLNVQNTQAYYLALGGIEKGKVYLVDQILNEDSEQFALNVAKKTPVYDSLSSDEQNDLSTGKLVEQDLEFAVFDETVFMNINITNPVNMMKLDGITEDFVVKVIDWKDKNDELFSSQSAESGYYIRQDRPYSAKNQEISHLRELLFIKDVDTDIYLGSYFESGLDDLYAYEIGKSSNDSEDGFPGLINLFTVFGEGKLNINTVPASMLISLPGINNEEAEILLDHRRSLASDEYLSSFDFLDELGFEEVLRDSIINNCCFVSNIFRIYSNAAVGQSRCCLIAVVQYAENELKTLYTERVF